MNDISTSTHNYIINLIEKSIPTLQFFLKSDIESLNKNIESVVLILDDTENLKEFFEQLTTILSQSPADRFFCQKLEFNIFSLLSDTEIQNSNLSVYIEKIRNFFKKVVFFKLKSNDQANEQPSNLYLFKIFNVLKNKNISLFLTKHTLIRQYFFKKIYNYCNFGDKFLISGSQIYTNEYIQNQEYFITKNETVCLYATGHPAFQALMKVLVYLISKDELLKLTNLNFLIDTFITYLKINISNIPQKSQDICEYIISNYKYNNYIRNLSSRSSGGSEKIIKIPLNSSIYASNIRPSLYYKSQEENIRKIFDPVFYIKSYPTTKNFLLSNSDLTEEERLFQHYISFGIDYGLFPNEEFKKNKP